MTRDEIIKLAKDAGFSDWYGTDDHAFLNVIERFANLVAQAERERCAVKAARMVNGKGVAAAIRAMGDAE